MKNILSSVIARRPKADAAIQLKNKQALDCFAVLAMTVISFFLFCLLPLSANATKLANCDTKPYDVTINNGGQAHVVTLHPGDSPLQEFGPVVSMQIPGDRLMVITEPHDEYCIWDGKIKIQRRNSDGVGGSGGLR